MSRRELLAAEVSDYLNELVPERPAEMQQMEAYAAEHDFPIIGPAAGYFCYQVARLCGARRVFELGSGYGYSTAWFARAVQENGGGVVHHVVWDEALSQRARGHLDKLGLGALVTYTVAEAVQTLRESEGPFDLIFIDINKDSYPEAVDVAEEKLSPGGVVIIDNVLWGGRIFDETDRSEATEAIRAVTMRLTRGPKWISTLAPIRDGLLVGYRRRDADTSWGTEA
ncbi:MAG: O-methyltransferase [Candidatus Promineifilaceae bacterium]|nr:O-methyltransferase [Candidatus Promineifilaceae bacterium]